ncbi:hypothetical protein L195_g033680 [Trifolium pratense]|uniref:Uncharacterized protein n=1 Tax=Trifolium pratense TaxID=57577 RepID=A0A2K3L4L0_TRIPR|nr:hypothetical protein L195_g029376 [Trifolium pratense]PNX77711.1 hypothetical protein L195_g033680 [Trifolium pratense]
MPKATIPCMMAHTTFKGSKEDQHLDNGYSKNMTRDKKNLKEKPKFKNKWSPQIKRQQNLKVKEDNVKMSHRMVQYLCSTAGSISSQEDKAKGDLGSKLPKNL